jgi:uncharacterized protein (TIGR00290 family)
LTGARPRALVSWSSGKDSAWALREVLRNGTVEPVGLVTTVTSSFGRVSMHGVRVEILRAQAERVGLPLFVVSIPAGCSNADYEAAFLAGLRQASPSGFERVVFGDLFLEDVRAYREALLEGTGIAPEFPLWRRDTAELAREMIEGGLDSILVCVDPNRVPAGLAGRRFDRDLLDELPPGADPCGENGEFHTCVVDGPMFSTAVPAVPGVRVARDGFVFADLELSFPGAQAVGA